ncbi:hypothetical protein ACFPRL_33245 [Pseudoclavibacter helvolus]
MGVGGVHITEHFPWWEPGQRRPRVHAQVSPKLARPVFDTHWPASTE